MQSIPEDIFKVNNSTKTTGKQKKLEQNKLPQ
jgi:zona occludens toxin (predicted ATPase)